MKLLPTLALLTVWTSITSFYCGKDKFPSHDGKKEVVLQPGPDDGQDCLVAYRENDGGLYANANHSGNPDFVALRWTYDSEGAGEGTNRSYIKFTELDKVPKNADIISAKLSLYGATSGVAAPLGNSFYPGSPYESWGENSAWLTRVVNDWNESTITWNNKPAVSEEFKVAIPFSNSQWNYSATDIDVTNMVREMIKTKKNYGFCMQLQTEEIYRSLLFSSSDANEKSLRPKLVVKYK